MTALTCFSAHVQSVTVMPSNSGFSEASQHKRQFTGTESMFRLIFQRRKVKKAATRILREDGIYLDARLRRSSHNPHRARRCKFDIGSLLVQPQKMPRLPLPCASVRQHNYFLDQAYKILFSHNIRFPQKIFYIDSPLQMLQIHKSSPYLTCFTIE